MKIAAHDILYHFSSFALMLAHVLSLVFATKRLIDQSLSACMLSIDSLGNWEMWEVIVSSTKKRGSYIILSYPLTCAIHGLSCHILFWVLFNNPLYWLYRLVLAWFESSIVSNWHSYIGRSLPLLQYVS